MKLFHKLLLILLAFTLLTGCKKAEPDPQPTADIPVVEPTPPSTEPDPTPETSVDPETTPEPTAEVTPDTEPSPEVTDEPAPTIEPEDLIDEDGIYDTADEVALYLYTYHHLPSNFMTKKEARKQGWTSGALNKTIEGMCIGGDVYGNYEKVLPKIKGKYYECDIETLHAKSRGAKRLVWSEYFDIYYTEDHYETFEQLYEGE